MATRFTFDDTAYRRFFLDFDEFEADDWVITTTEAGAGAATEAISNADGGVLLITNDDADDDLDFLQWAKETFKFEVGKRLFFKARFKLGDVTESDFVIGLMITDTTMLDVTDGIFFQKDDGDAFLDFHVEKNNTASSKTAVATLVNDTFVTVAFDYDGSSSKIRAYVNDEGVGYTDLTNAPDDEELTISFGIQNGAAAAKTLSLDYVLVVKER